MIDHISLISPRGISDWVNASKVAIQLIVPSIEITRMSIHCMTVITMPDYHKAFRVRFVLDI